MKNNNLVKIFSTLTAVICVLALVAAMAGFANSLDGTSDKKAAYDAMNEKTQKLEDNRNIVKNEKSGYEKNKAAYEVALSAYDEDYAAYEESVADYESAVMEYNINLVTYSAGKSAAASGQSKIEQGKQEIAAGWDGYNQGVAALDAGIQQYNQLISGIAAMEAQGMPHEMALAAVSEAAGVTVTDETIAQTKQQLDSSKAQLDELKAGLESGSAQLNAAQSQLNQLTSMGAKLPDDFAQLSDSEAQLKADKAALDERSEALSKQKDEIENYEDAEIKAVRFENELKDAGIKGDDILQAAKSETLKLKTAYIINRAASILMTALLAGSAVLGFFAARKEKYKLAFWSALTSAMALVFGIFCAKLVGGWPFAGAALMGVCAGFYAYGMKLDEKEPEEKTE